MREVSLELLFCIQNYQRQLDCHGRSVAARCTRALDRKKLHEADVAAFKNLPEDLLQRLHVEVYSPVPWLSRAKA